MYVLRMLNRIAVPRTESACPCHLLKMYQAAKSKSVIGYDILEVMKRA